LVAAEIAERFYRRVRAGESPEQSLAIAQREMIADRSDFGWAAYTVSGMSARKSRARVRATSTEP
jgi:hypothetical protein